MNRRLSLLATAIIVLSSGLVSPVSAAPVAPVTEISVSSQVPGASLTLVRWRPYWYKEEVLWVVGEVQNTGLTPVAQPMVTGRFVDSAGAVVNELAVYTDADLLAPGGTSTFRITYNRPTTTDVKLAAIDLTGTPTDVLPQGGLSAFAQDAKYEEVEQDRVGSKPGCDPDKDDCTTIEKVMVSTGNYLIIGGVRNGGTQPLQNVRVTVAIYNQAGELINTGITARPIPVLAPGATEGFNIIVYWAPNVSTYTVRAVSTNFIG